MGKKKPEEMAKQREFFLSGAKEKGVDPDVASSIFDLMEKFAGYGFNKSHSAAYALVAYQTAWLKAHFPAAFMAAVLSADMDHTDKVVSLIDECRRMGLEVRPPDINRCAYRFTVADESTVRYGLGAIKGVGQSAIDAVLAERDENGPFADLFELCRRIDLRKANRRVLDALIRAGALDSLGPTRSVMAASLDHALQIAEQHNKNDAAGQNDLFGLDAPAVAPQESELPGDGAFVTVPEWSEEDRLAAEKETLGLYLTGHPINRYEAELQRLVSCRLADLRPAGKRSLTVAGMVVDLRTRNTARGRMAFVTLDDRTARADVTVYSEVLQKCADLLARDRIIVVRGTCSVDDYTGQCAITAEDLYDVQQARDAFARKLIVRLDAARAGNGLVAELQGILGPYRQGPCPVTIDYHGTEAGARLALGAAWQVKVTDTLLEQLRAALGQESICVEY